MTTGGNRRSIFSKQSTIHDHLESVVERHLRSRYLKPPVEHTKQAFDVVCEFISMQQKPLILDSGCGTGESSLQLAESHPDHWVIGLDKSAVRLTKATNKKSPDNLLFIRADQFDFWRLAAAANWIFESHFLFYPNPWPKKSHLMRRIHAHPAFTDLLHISKHLILRSNWRIYVEEFARAFEFVTGRVGDLKQIHPNVAVSLFEKKFLAGGIDLYEFHGCIKQ